MISLLVAGFLCVVAHYASGGALGDRALYAEFAYLGLLLVSFIALGFGLLNCYARLLLTIRMHKKRLVLPGYIGVSSWLVCILTLAVPPVLCSPLFTAAREEQAIEVRFVAIGALLCSIFAMFTLYWEASQALRDKSVTQGTLRSDTPSVKLDDGGEDFGDFPRRELPL